MRWLLIACLGVAGAHRASAERIVIQRPTVMECHSAKSWTGIVDCLKSHNFTTSHERTLGAARAVEVRGEWGPSVALYIHRGAQWDLGGLYEIADSSGDFELLALEPVTSGGQTGYRIDVGVVQSVSITFDTQAAAAGLLLARHALFCHGASDTCTDLVVACDTVVDGIGYSSFHGELKQTDRDVSVTGDARFAAPGCPGAQVQPLRWQAGGQ